MKYSKHPNSSLLLGNTNRSLSIDNRDWKSAAIAKVCDDCGVQSGQLSDTLRWGYHKYPQGYLEMRGSAPKLGKQGLLCGACTFRAVSALKKTGDFESITSAMYCARCHQMPKNAMLNHNTQAPNEASRKLCGPSKPSLKAPTYRECCDAKRNAITLTMPCGICNVIHSHTKLEWRRQLKVENGVRVALYIYA